MCHSQGTALSPLPVPDCVQHSPGAAPSTAQGSTGIATTAAVTPSVGDTFLSLPAGSGVAGSGGLQVMEETGALGKMEALRVWSRYSLQRVTGCQSPLCK